MTVQEKQEIEYNIEQWQYSNDPDKEAHITKLKQQLHNANQKTFTAVDFDDILDEEIPPEKYVVDDLIPEVGLTVLLGGQKIGKSWVILGLAQAVSVGGMAFGKISVAKQKVLYLGLEDGRVIAYRRAEQLGFRKSGGFLSFVDNLEPKADPVKMLDTYLERNPETRLVLIDTLQYFFAFSDMNDYAGLVNRLKVLREVAIRRNVSVVVTHHTRKSSNNDNGGDFTERALGSQAIAATCDTVLMLSRNRQEKRADLNITGRTTFEKTFVMQFDDDCGWVLEGDKTEVIEGDTQRLIVEWLKENGASGPTAIYKGLKENGYTGSMGSIKTLLHRMTKAGKLVNVSGVYAPSTVNPETGVNPVNLSTIPEQPPKKVDTVDRVDSTRSETQKVINFPTPIEQLEKTAEELDKENNEPDIW